MKTLRYISFVIIFTLVIYGLSGIIGMRTYAIDNVIDKKISWLVYPVVKLQNMLVSPVSYYLNLFNNKKSLETMRQEFDQAYQDVLAENIKLSSQIESFKDIEEIIAFKKRYNQNNIITGQVIAKHFNPTEHFFIIDVGSKHGVALDMVAVYKNVIVGRISCVYPTHSYVTLITDGSCKIDAFCRDSQDVGVHEGCFDINRTRLTYVFDTTLDLQKRIKKGDIVISSGQGLVFPRGFGLGRVVECRHQNFHFDILLEPLIDFNKINSCCIIAKSACYSGEIDNQIDDNKDAEITNNSNQLKLDRAKIDQAKPDQVKIEKRAVSKPQPVNIAAKTTTVYLAPSAPKTQQSSSSQTASVAQASKPAPAAPIVIVERVENEQTSDKQDNLPEQQAISAQDQTNIESKQTISSQEILSQQEKMAEPQENLQAQAAPEI